MITKSLQQYFQKDLTKETIEDMLISMEFDILYASMIVDVWISVSMKNDNYYVHFVDTEMNSKPVLLVLDDSDSHKNYENDFFKFSTLKEVKDLLNELGRVFKLHEEYENSDSDELLDKSDAIGDVDLEKHGMEFLMNIDNDKYLQSDEFKDFKELYSTNGANGTNPIKIMVLCGIFGDYKRSAYFVEDSFFRNKFIKREKYHIDDKIITSDNLKMVISSKYGWVSIETPKNKRTFCYGNDENNLLSNNLLFAYGTLKEEYTGLFDNINEEVSEYLETIRYRLKLSRELDGYDINPLLWDNQLNQLKRPKDSNE